MTKFDPKMTAKAARAVAPSLSHEDAVAWLKLEEAGKDRSTVKDALRARRDELDSKRRRKALPEVASAVAAAAPKRPAGPYEMSATVKMES